MLFFSSPLRWASAKEQGRASRAAGCPLKCFGTIMKV